jgi:hypothetical protein
VCGTCNHPLSPSFTGIFLSGKETETKDSAMC